MHVRLHSLLPLVHLALGALRGQAEVAPPERPLALDAPQIRRDRHGLVHLSGAPALYYSIDGSEPALRYDQPFALPEGGMVKALAMLERARSAVACRTFDIAKTNWRIRQASAPGAEKLIDDDPDTAWDSSAGQYRRKGDARLPHQVTLDLGRYRKLTGFSLTPAATLPPGVGAPATFECHLSADGAGWALAATGEFTDIGNHGAQHIHRFTQARHARYLRLVLPRATAGPRHVAFAELGVLTR